MCSQDLNSLSLLTHLLLLLKYNTVNKYKIYWGDFVQGDFVIGGFCPRGDFVQGDFVRGVLSWGFCPGGFCPDTIYMMVSKGMILETLDFKSLIQDLMNHKDIL